MDGSLTSFAEWMQRVRRGDEQAASDLVRQYERAVRVAVRSRLTDPKHRRLLDSVDVAQSVMASFFVRAAAGQYDLDRPQQLVSLLVKMAQNKLNEQIRRNRRQMRDVGRDEGAGDAAPLVADREPGPVQHAAGRELLDELLNLLDGPERELAQRRAIGQSWKEIAGDLGGLPQAHRMRLSRAIDRLAPRLGLFEGEEDESDS